MSGIWNRVIAIVRGLKVTCSEQSEQSEPARHFSWEEVRQNGYIVAHGIVYDPSQFITYHPAGSLPIINNLGSDCTVHYDFHRSTGKKIWEQYKVGILKR